MLSVALENLQSQRRDTIKAISTSGDAVSKALARMLRTLLSKVIFRKEVIANSLKATMMALTLWSKVWRQVSVKVQLTHELHDKIKFGVPVLSKTSICR